MVINFIFPDRRLRRKFTGMFTLVAVYIALLVFAPACFAATAEVTAFAVKVRATANPNSEIVGYLKKGDKVPILESPSGLKWLAIDFRGVRGFLQKWTVQVSGDGDKGVAAIRYGVEEIDPSALPVVVARVSEMPVRIVPEKTQLTDYATDLLLLEAMRTAPAYSLGNGEQVRAVRAGDLVAFFGEKNRDKPIRGYLKRSIVRGISTDAGVLIIADFHRLRWLPQ